MYTLYIDAFYVFIIRYSYVCYVDSLLVVTHVCFKIISIVAVQWVSFNGKTGIPI